MEINLSKKAKSKIDDIDNNELKWYLGGNGYAMRGRSKAVTYLHRWVMERKLGRKLKKKEQVDHINRDKLDNRRSNLRLVNYSQNQANAKIRVDNKSGHKGVTLDKRNGNYTAQYYLNSKKIHIGSFKTLEEAIRARKNIEDKLYGSFYRHG